MKQPIPLLIIEDDSRVAQLLRCSLEEQGYEVYLAYDAHFAQKLLQQQPIHLIISDIILPDLDGLQLCKKIRIQYPHLPIILLTALGSTDDKVEGFDAGADDYLVKPFELRELFARIAALLKRRERSPLLVPKQLRLADLELNLETKITRRGQQIIHLTPKEFKLLSFLLQNAHRVLSRAEIAQQVWDTHFDTGTNFIDVYINYLRNKIDKPYDRKLIHTKPGMGFIMTDQPC
jgi:DNA-binding response OmpR family regulator